MALENLGTFTKIDSGGDIGEPTQFKRTATTMRRDANSVVYRDDGPGKFVNIDHFIQGFLSAADVFSLGIFYSLSDVAAATYADLVAANNGFAVTFVGVGGPAYNIQFVKFQAGPDDVDSYMISLSTNYYCTVHRDAVNLQLFIYSDSGRTVLLDTLSISMAVGSQYLNVIGSRDDPGFSPAASITYSSENLDLQEGTIPVFMKYYRNRRIW